MKIFKKEQKGITLIALVITIIVLLILAGISISMLSGQNGVLNNAQEAKLANICGNFNEQVSLAQMATKTSIMSKMTSKSGYRATESNNLSELATDVAKGLGLTLSGNTTNGEKINTEGYTVAYYLDTPGDASTNGVGYIVIWYTNNAFRALIKDRTEFMNRYKITETIEDSELNNITKSKNQAVLVAAIKVENYDCTLSTAVGLTSKTNGENDLNSDKFGETSLNGDFGFSLANAEEIITFYCHFFGTEENEIRAFTARKGMTFGQWIEENPTAGWSLNTNYSTGPFVQYRS